MNYPASKQRGIKSKERLKVLERVLTCKYHAIEIVREWLHK